MFSMSAVSSTLNTQTKSLIPKISLAVVAGAFGVAAPVMANQNPTTNNADYKQHLYRLKPYKALTQKLNAFLNNPKILNEIEKSGIQMNDEVIQEATLVLTSSKNQKEAIKNLCNYIGTKAVLQKKKVLLQSMLKTMPAYNEKGQLQASSAAKMLKLAREVYAYPNNNVMNKEYRDTVKEIFKDKLLNKNSFFMHYDGSIKYYLKDGLQMTDSKYGVFLKGKNSEQRIDFADFQYDIKSDLDEDEFWMNATDFAV